MFFMNIFLKQARYPNVCDNDGDLRGVRVDQLAQDSARPLEELSLLFAPLLKNIIILVNFK